MPDATGNIFLTWENLAFSLPLLLVCLVYVYFKYVPLTIGLPILAGLFVIYQIRQQMISQRNKKLENLDDKAIQDLIGEEEADAAKKSDNDAAAKEEAKRKAANKLKARLEQERKAEEKKAKSAKASKKSSKNAVSSAAAADEDEDDVDLTAFTKVAKKKTK